MDKNSLVLNRGVNENEVKQIFLVLPIKPYFYKFLRNIIGSHLRLIRKFQDPKWVIRSCNSNPQKGVVGKLRCSGKECSSCFTSDTRCVTLIKHPMVSHDWGQDEIISVVICNTQYSVINCQHSHCGDHKTFEVIISTQLLGTLDFSSFIVRQQPSIKEVVID